MYSEFKVVGDGGSTDVLEQTGITRDEGFLVESHGKDASQPDELGGPSHMPDDVRGQFSAGVSQVVTEVASGNIAMNISENVAEPSVESFGKVTEDVIIVDNDKDLQKGAMYVEQTIEDNESTAVANEKEQPEEKGPEIQEEHTGIEIEEERGVEIQPDVDSPPDEVAVEVQPEETRVEPGQFDSKETEHIAQTTEQQILQPVEDIKVGGSVEPMFDQVREVDESQPIDVEADQSDSGAVGQEIPHVDDSVTPVEGMEESVSEVSTQGAPQESPVSGETQEIVEDKQSQSSHVPSEEPLQPSFESPKESPSLEPHPILPSLHPPVQVPPPFEAPTHLQPPSHQTLQIAPHLPSEVGKETEPTTPEKTSTPPRRAPHIEPPPREPTPQEDTPLKGTPPRGTPPKQNPPSPRETLPPPPDPLAEAKAKARSVVEMRERRLNEEIQAEMRGDDSGYDVDHYEQERIPATESRQVTHERKDFLLYIFLNIWVHFTTSCKFILYT